MLRGEVRGRDSPDAAVRPQLVVVASPPCALGSSLCQTGEPVLVQTFISDAPIEALDVSVLRRATRLDQDVFDLV